jgi:hypothetical protein
MLSHHRVTDRDVTGAALLHDAIEHLALDIAPGGTRQDAFTLLAGRFGDRSADLVVGQQSI